MTRCYKVLRRSRGLLVSLLPSSSELSVIYRFGEWVFPPNRISGGLFYYRLLDDARTLRKVINHNSLCIVECVADKEWNVTGTWNVNGAIKRSGIDWPREYASNRLKLVRIIE